MVQDSEIEPRTIERRIILLAEESSQMHWVVLPASHAISIVSSAELPIYKTLKSCFGRQVHQSRTKISLQVIVAAVNYVGSVAKK
ncbi:hypothetical protein ABKN59_009834 [Abortiporus biennis]